MLLGTLQLAISCSEKEKKALREAPDSLPFQYLSLDDLGDFGPENTGWEIAGRIRATENGFTTENGKGTLVKAATASTRLSSAFQHGDLDLELDFVLSADAGFSILLQGRYPVVVAEYAGGQPTPRSSGGIVQNADGSLSASNVNALKAPGLWQNLKLTFRAPRFDQSGNKTSNAIIESLSLNGFEVQAAVELEGPAVEGVNSEVPAAPLALSGSNGAIAIKNIGYKSYGLEALTLAGLSYDLYSGTWDKLPDFSKLTPTSSGQVEELSIRGISEGNDHYGIVFNGKLTVPVSGEYLFTTYIDDGGELYIDNQLIVHNDGEPGGGLGRGLVTLEKGVHDLSMSYYQDVWGSAMLIFYEGPGISRKTLGPPLPPRRENGNEPIVLLPDDEPIAIRSFINHKTGTKTHPISVINASKVNYTYDLLTGALVKGWKGAYADAGPMWNNRGESQLLTPLNFSVDFSDKPPVARLTSNVQAWPDAPQEGFKAVGYTFDDSAIPTVMYTIDRLSVEDKTRPNANNTGITRTVSFSNLGGSSTAWFQLAAGDEIYQMPNGWYCVDGSYYVIVEEQAGVNVVNRFDRELVIQLPAGAENFALTYSIVW